VPPTFLHRYVGVLAHAVDREVDLVQCRCHPLDCPMRLRNPHAVVWGRESW
jgi:hypothetical protein